MKWCWHKWDVTITMRSFSNTCITYIKRTEKKCNKYGVTRIKEELW